MASKKWYVFSYMELLFGFESLQNLVSMEANYYQFHEEFRDIYLTPCIPLLGNKTVKILQ